MVRISVELPDEMAEALDCIARETDMTVEALIVDIVTAHIAAQIDGEAPEASMHAAPRPTNPGNRNQLSL